MIQKGGTYSENNLQAVMFQCNPTQIVFKVLYRSKSRERKKNQL